MGHGQPATDGMQRDIEVVDFGSHSSRIHFFGDAATALEDKVLGDAGKGLL